MELIDHVMLSKIVNPSAPGHSKKLKIIGRRNQSFKTPQGEFLVPEALENHYLTSPYVALIFVHAESLRDHVVAVVVPDSETFQSALKLEKLGPDSLSLVKEKIMDELKAITERFGLANYSRPRDIHVEWDPKAWESNHLFTGNQKLVRPKLASFYAKEIGEMYRTLEENERCLSLHSST